MEEGDLKSTSFRREYKCSKEITQPLVNLILKQELTLENLDKEAVELTKLRLKVEKEAKHKQCFSELCEKVSSRTKRAIMLAREKGASAWLTALPLKALSYAQQAGVPRQCGSEIQLANQRHSSNMCMWIKEQCSAHPRL